MRVVIWTRLTGRRFRERLEAHPSLEVLVPADAAEAIGMVRGADLLVTDGAYDPTLAAALRHDRGRLRFIQLVTAGYDGLTALGVPDGVAVSNVGGFFSATVAEHAIALLIALLRQLSHAVADTERHIQDRGMATQVRSLQGADVVIIGFGSIGQELARRLRPFGVRILALVQTPRFEALADEIHTRRSLHAILARADAAIVAAPLTAATRRLIGQAEFAACKRGMILINVARGELVDTAALAAALAGGQIGGAGLDVTDPEPLPPDHPLWASPNLIVTPHVAGSGRRGAADRMADVVLANIALLAAGKPPLHQVSV